MPFFFFKLFNLGGISQNVLYKGLPFWFIGFFYVLTFITKLLNFLSFMRKCQFLFLNPIKLIYAFADYNNCIIAITKFPEMSLYN